MDGNVPAEEAAIAEIRKREVNGLIELPKPSALQRGDRVRILHGPFSGQLAIYADMRSRERIEVLLRLLGGQQRVILPRVDIETVP